MFRPQRIAPATKVDRVSKGGGWPDGAEEHGRDRRTSLESALDLRLRVLLHDLLRDKSHGQVAELLGISYETLVRSLETGWLTEAEVCRGRGPAGPCQCRGAPGRA